MKMKYPWFAPKMQVFESGAVQDMCGEDVSFCLGCNRMQDMKSGVIQGFVLDMKNKMRVI